LDFVSEAPWSFDAVELVPEFDGVFGFESGELITSFLASKSRVVVEFELEFKLEFELELEVEFKDPCIMGLVLTSYPPPYT
jgi:hypothetical protein